MKMKLFILSLVVTLLMTACTGGAKENEADRESHIQTYLKESKFPDIEIETEVGEYDDYKYAIHFPRTKQPEINQQIKSFITKHKTDFLNKIKNLQPEKGNFSELLLDYNITHLSDNLLSIVFSSSVHLAGENSTNYVHALNFDRKQGKQIKLEHLLADDSSLQKIAEISQDKVMQDAKVMKVTDETRLNNGTVPKLKNYNTYSFSNNSMDIHFEEKQIGPKSLGNYKVSIPLNDLKNIIKTSYIESLELSIDNETKILSNTTSIDQDHNKQTTLDPGGKYVALTFDDGPHKELTPYILSVLKKHKARATFYVLGNRVEYYPDIVKRAFDEGHEIGSHSWSHPKLTSLSQSELLKQMNETSNMIAKITGKAPATTRPPYGAFDNTVQKAINGPIVNWSVDTLDWKHKNKELVKKIAIENTTNGSIILMHDIQQATAQALDDIIKELSAQGYQFVTVSELLELEDNPKKHAGQVFMNRKSS